MQDLRTGELKTVDQDKVAKMIGAKQTALGNALSIPPEMQGPIFHEGEILEIKGAKFKIARINSWRMVLDVVKP